MAAHQFDPVSRICVCGTTEKQAIEGQKTICPVDRSPPQGARVRPTSFDANPGEIGDRLKEIQAQERTS